MSNKKMVPEIRFKGYEGEWEEKKIGSISDSYSGGTPNVSNRDYYNGDIPFIRSGEINNNITELYITKEGLRSSSAKLVNKGDILYALYGATSGEVSISKIRGAINQAVLCIRMHNNYDDLFARYWLGKNKNDIIDKYLQGGQGNLSGGIVKQLTISLPLNSKEQKQIGNMFAKTDRNIEKKQLELKKLKQFKQAMLQKMFPKEGETVPEIRFEGFSGEWMVHKLKDLGTTFTSLSGKTKEDFGHGNAEFVTYMNVFSNTVAKSNQTDKIEIDPKQSEVQYGDIFFTTSSETPEEVGMSSVWVHDKKNVYLNSFCFGYRPYQKMNPYYMAYMLRAPVIRDKFIVLAQGISRYNISKIKAMEISIYLPADDEQIAIGNFFKELDNKIGLEEQNLEKMKQFKKAMLQKMFV